MSIIYVGGSYNSSWPQVTSLTVARPVPNGFTCVILAGVIIGRDGSPSPTAVITPPDDGWILDWLYDGTADTYPSMFALYHKFVVPAIAEPLTYTWSVTPARSMNVELMGLENVKLVTVATDTQYSGVTGDPQYVRDEALVITPALPVEPPYKVLWAGFTGFGPQDEFGFNSSQGWSSIANDDIYSTRLFPAGTYSICILPYDRSFWDTTESSAQLRITRTQEQHSMGRRQSPTPVSGVIADTLAASGTVTDPSIGTQLYRSTFTGFTDESDTPTSIANWFGQPPAYTGWMKLVLTTPMWLCLDTYGSSMQDTVLFVFDGVATLTSNYLYVSDDSNERPYRISGFYTSGTIGITSPNPIIQQDTRFDFYTQQTFIIRSQPGTPTTSLYTMDGDFGSRRRAAATFGLYEGVTISTDWAYQPGTVTVNGSTVGVTEDNPATGQVSIVPAPTSPYTVTYLAAGGQANPIDIYPDSSAVTGSVPVMRANGLSPSTP